jgi:hypothetical protein
MTDSNNHLGKRLWQAWLRFGHWIGNVMSWVWMPLFYFVFAMPVALVIKLVSDPLRIRVGRQKSYWIPKEMPKLDMQWAKSQGSVSSKASEASQ